MKQKLLFLFIFLNTVLGFSQEIKWHTNLEEAAALGKDTDKKVILVFSGSDWCKPCIQLKSEVLESPEFIEKANDKYIFVNIDFKRNQRGVSKETIKYNESIAEKYNSKGAFPYVVVFDKNLNILKKIDGYKGETTEVFLEKYFN
ncbi:thioredoxin family protein [Aureivirga sp. CE67]|uniref:thioredoxin family protein n=1 Tax=Aureivirga sp. CE67 TaxID=1788983 RepID=UPI0018CAA39D|nr:thioredoxin fold domain-containing protein [Aureivirga sp. CE67]